MAKKKAASKPRSIQVVEEAPAEAEPTTTETPTSEAPKMAVKKKRAVKKTTNKRRGPQGESKSAQIQSYMTKHPEKANKEVFEALTGKIDGITIGDVGNARQLLKKKNKGLAGIGFGEKRLQRMERSKGSNGAQLDADTVAEFVKSAGGLDQAINYLQTIKAVSERVPF